MADWVANPLVNISSINERLDAVAELVADSRVCDELREKLHGIYDLQRLLSRISTGRASPRDLAHVGQTLAALPAVKAKITGRKSASLLRQLEAALDLCPEMRAQLETALVDRLPAAEPRRAASSAAGFHAELDGLRELAAGGKQWIARIRRRKRNARASPI